MVQNQNPFDSLQTQSMTFQEEKAMIFSIHKYTIIECVLGLCFTAITVLMQLPYEYIGEQPVPTVVFKGRPATFQAFVVSIVFAFSGSTNALMDYNKTKFSRFCGYYAMASMASAILILFWALVCSCAS